MSLEENIKHIMEAGLKDYANPIEAPEMPSEELAIEDKPAEEVPTEPKAIEDKPQGDVEQGKEYLGNKGDDAYFYLVYTPGAEGSEPTNPQILDAEEKVVFPVEGETPEAPIGEGEEPKKLADFILDALKVLELSNVSAEIVTKYIVPPVEEEEAEDETEERKENAEELGKEEENPSEVETPTMEEPELNKMGQ